MRGRNQKCESSVEVKNEILIQISLFFLCIYFLALAGETDAAAAAAADPSMSPTQYIVSHLIPILC